MQVKLKPVLVYEVIVAPDSGNMQRAMTSVLIGGGCSTGGNSPPTQNR